MKTSSDSVSISSVTVGVRNWLRDSGIAWKGKKRPQCFSPDSGNQSQGVTKKVPSIAIASAMLLWGICSLPAVAATSTVCPAGCDYASIQDAIDHANDGDVIEIQSGQYNESITVHRRVTLAGVNTGTGDPIIDAGGAPFALRIEAPDVQLSQLKVREASHTAIQIGDNNAKLDHLTIYHNVEVIVSLSRPAVVGWERSGIEISACTFVVEFDAVVLYDPENYSIRNNTFLNPMGYSVSIVSSSGTDPVKKGVISGNTLTKANGGGIQIRALTAAGLVEDLVIEDNLIAGSGGSIGLFIPAQGGVFIRNNTLRKTPATVKGFYGIMTYGTSGVVVDHNHADNIDVELAFRFEACSGLTVTGNIVDANTDVGVGLIAVTDSVFSDNIMTGSPNNFWVAPSVLDPGLLPGNQIDTSNLVDGKPVWYLEGVDGLTIDGSEGIGTLVLYGCNNATIKNLTGHANGAGVSATRSENLTVANCTFHGMYNGIFAVQSPNLTVIDNQLVGCFEGLKLGNFEGGLVAGNTILSSGDGGILTGGYLFDVTIRDNVIHGAVAGIYLDHVVGKNSVMSGNSIKATTKAGISSAGSINMTLTRNFLQPLAEVGFDLGESSACTITENTLEGTALIAVSLAESPLNSISANQLKCLGSGVLMSRKTDEPGSLGNVIVDNLVTCSTPARFWVSESLGNLDYPKFTRGPYTPVSDIPQISLVVVQPPTPPPGGETIDPNPPFNVWNTTKAVGLNIVGGPYLGGNYWASPLGDGFSQTQPDRGDGFCTEPLVLGDNNIDHLPLHLASPAGILQDLINTVQEYGLPAGIENSLVEKLNVASKKLSEAKPRPAGQILHAFINEANAQRGKALTGSQADDLVALAEWIINAIPGK